MCFGYREIVGYGMLVEQIYWLILF